MDTKIGDYNIQVCDDNGVTLTNNNLKQVLLHKP